jgi:uroporphyrinogen III methyltransferase/synthase
VRGKVYLVGAGPGDPELVTRRGARRLAEADLVLYDALVHPDVLAHCRPDAERVFVGKRAGRAGARQAEINRRLVEAARAGRVVVRLKGGDPFLFGRGSEEAEHLAAAGIPFEVVPGVSSTLAATAYAGIALTHRDLASSIAYVTATESPEKDATAHDWTKLATATQTLVLFMGARKLDSLMRLLMAHGRSPSCPAAVVQWASLPRQRTVVGTVGDIAEKARAADLGMPSLTIVGEVVRLRAQLRWYDTKPLFGRRVLVSRASGQGHAFARALRDAGAEPVELPAIRIVPPDDPAPLTRAVSRLGGYDWVLFTSENGVEACFGELARQRRDARAFGAARVGAVGPATAAALFAHGVAADVVPAEHRGEALAAEVVAHHGKPLAGAAVLLLRAAVAREALPELLTQAGARVDVAEAYRTLPPEETDLARLRAAIAERDVDVVTFTSPSTITHTVSALGPDAPALLARVTVASIGPVTSDAARQHGVRVDVTAAPYTTDGLVAALEAHFLAAAVP